MTMSLSMYQASVPVFTRALSNLKVVLQKGEAFAVEKGFSKRGFHAAAQPFWTAAIVRSGRFRGQGDYL